MLTLNCSMTSSVIGLGAGALVTTYVLTLLGLCVSVMSISNTEAEVLILAIICILVFLVLHSLDHASLALYSNTNITYSIRIMATNIHAFHVLVCLVILLNVNITALY